ncbi:MAG: hypothetical protein IKE63_02090 [Bacilli bacterium]|nr:hypothetical protein [Bacilli bacterium]
MKKKINRQFTEAEKEYIRKNKKILLIRSVLMLGFLLVFNVFAWFIYVSKVNTEMDIKALSWDVVFSEGGNAVKDVVIALDVYPGMEEYTHTISVTNASETAANLFFDTKSVTLFGSEMLTDTTMTEAQKEQFLMTVLPLTIQYQFGNTVMQQSTQSSFTVKINWEYENNNYYKVPAIFGYSADLTYYTKSGSTYTVTEVTGSTYNALKNSLYLTKDDIDSYIGEQCGYYQRANGKSCLVLKGELVAEQSQAGS